MVSVEAEIAGAFQFSGLIPIIIIIEITHQTRCIHTDLQNIIITIVNVYLPSTSLVQKCV